MKSWWHISLTSPSACALLCAAIPLFCPCPSLAHGPYRCHGVVQFRPCNQAFSYDEQGQASVEGAIPTIPSQAQTAAVQTRSEAPRFGYVYSSGFARITSHTFRRVSEDEGVWNGIVEGSGRVHLQLQWFKSGALHSTLPMGSVVLSNRSTTFGFRTAVPHGDDWTWRLTAFSTNS